MLEPLSKEAEKLVNSLEPERVDGYTIALGHAFDQITLHGVFETFDEALAYTEAFTNNYDWHIVPLWKISE